MLALISTKYSNGLRSFTFSFTFTDNAAGISLKTGKTVTYLFIIRFSSFLKIKNTI